LVEPLWQSVSWESCRHSHASLSCIAFYLLPALQGILLMLSLASQLCFLRVYGGLASSNWQSAGQPVNQEFSLSELHYPKTERQVRRAAAQCSLDPDQLQHHLVIDESSYFVFRKSNEPLFAAYFDDRGSGTIALTRRISSTVCTPAG
jgi:hypothetical protein